MVTPPELLPTLAEPTRRALYEYVARQPDAVGREAAASATGISRRLAAFHLDRLVDAGLLAVEYRRLTGRTGPGAGRPAKLYRAIRREVSVTVPERNYLRAARLLLDALASAPGATAPRLAAVARRHGRDLGRRLRSHSAGDQAGVAGEPAIDGTARGLERALTLLGYGPVWRDGVLRLANCPFRLLAEQNRDLTCAANLALLQAAAAELRENPPRARLVHEPGWCCVRFESTH